MVFLSVTPMEDTNVAAIVMAAREVSPADPSDLTGIITDPHERAALLSMSTGAGRLALTRYLHESMDWGRVEHWRKALALAAETQEYVVLVAGTSGYPARLGATWDAPPVLFGRGRLPEAAKRSIAVVGSRDADQRTLRSAHRVAAELADGGFDIVSGLAAGVDGAAHEGALSAGGTTTAVLGTGINLVYPEHHRLLARRVASNGLLLSQFPPDAPRTATSFLTRNRVIAGMTEASVVMEGRARSGSRHELECALSYGRPVFLWAPSTEAEAWARQLVRVGQASFVSSSTEVLEAMGGVRQ